jgi:type I restriction enzyme S subunit
MAEKTLAPVTTAEKPYLLPDGWEWKSIGKINTYKGKSFDPSSNPTALFELYSVPSSADEYPEIVTGSEIGSTKQIVLKDDVLLCKINPRINRVWKVSGFTANTLLASSEWIIVRDDDADTDYLMWWCRSPFFREFMLSNVSGVGGSLMRAQPKYVTAYPIPLPPLATQQKIVTQIESLFEKLDRARELLASAQESFATRRTAILHKAFTGELTAQWRAEHGVGLESWEKKPLSALCDSFQYGTSQKSDKSGDCVVLRMGNLQGGEIDWNNLAYTSDKEDIAKYSLKVGDVLFNRTNSAELVGKTSVYRGELPAIFAGYLIRINFRDCLDGYYLNYVMNSQRAKEYCHEVKTDAVNQSNINAKKLAAFVIPLPTLPEQQEIVRILDSVFAQEQKAQELADAVDRVDMMKKAVLARAFRGELC